MECRFEYAVPQTVPEIFPHLAGPDVLLKAGGIDLLDLMKEGILSPKCLINIRFLKGLKFLEETPEGGLRLGPMVTLGELGEWQKVPHRYRALTQAATAAATPQIRNVGTVGGNLCQKPHCWYFRSKDFLCLRKGGNTCFAGDGENQYHAIFGNHDGCVMVHPSALAVALTALKARLKIASHQGVREIGIEEFFVTPAQDMTRDNTLRHNEVITEITLPPTPAGFTSFYHKQRAKQSFDWPIAEAAVALTLEGGKCREAKVVLGAAAPIPWPLPQAEAVLRDSVVTKETAEQAAHEAMKDASPLAQNGYKVKVFQAVITRAICWAAEVDPLK